MNLHLIRRASIIALAISSIAAVPALASVGDGTSNTLQYAASHHRAVALALMESEGP